MKALVTGATGLIGSFLVEALRAEGFAVRALVRKTSDLSLITDPTVALAYGDLRDKASLAAAMEDVEVVFHTAARMSDWGPWQDYYEDNVLGTRNLLEVATAAKVRRFVHTSSTGVVGLGAFLDADETTPFDPEGEYEVSKVEQEKLVWEFREERGLPVTVVRPCWTLGPRSRRHVPILMQSFDNPLFMLVGSGENRISTIDPRDAAVGHVLAAKSDAAEGETYILTNGSSTDTQAGLYRAAAEAMGRKAPRLHAPFWFAEAAGWAAEKWARAFRWDDAPMMTPIRIKFLSRNRHFSCEKARRELGYRPRIQMAEAIADGVAWQRGERPLARAA
jgi:nucleoside-diphosphate-sugar epimerase